MIQRVDRHAEHHFASLCVAAGAACNKSEDDRHGWDHIVEIPPVPHPYRPPDRQPRLITVLVQVKSTKTNVPTARIKLSNALKAIQSDLPCFIVLFSYSDISTTVYAKHVWLDLMERTLKRARQAELHGFNSLHKQQLSISFGENDRIEESDLVAWIQDTVSAIGEDYASKKIQMRENCGYETGRYIATLTLGPLEHAQQIVDHEIGLLDSLPVTNFVLHEERFGIQSIHPEFSSLKGRIQIQRETTREAILVVSNQRGERFELSADVRIPSLVSIEHEAFKVRVQAGVLDFTFSPGRNHVQPFRLSYDEGMTYSLHEQIRFFDFVQWCKEGDIDLRLNSDIGTLFGAKVQVGHEVNDWEISALQSYLKLLFNIGGDAQSRNIPTTGIDLQNSAKSSYLIAMLVEAQDLRIGIHTVVSEPEVDLFSGFVIIELGNWFFTSILEFKIVNTIQETESTAWDMQFGKFLVGTARSVEYEQAKATLKAAFDRYTEASDSRIMYLEDGDLKHLANLEGSEVSMNTNR